MSIQASGVSSSQSSSAAGAKKNPTIDDYKELIKNILNSYKSGVCVNGLFDFSQYYYDEKTAKSIESSLTGYASGALGWYNSQDYYCKKGHNATRDESVQAEKRKLQSFI